MSSSSLPSDDDVQVAQVADPRHGRLLAEPHAAVPGAGDHRAVVGDREPGADAGLRGRRTSTCGPQTLICSMISFMKYGTSTGNSPPRSMPASCSMISMPERAVERVVRLDQRADAVLQLRDHLAGAVVRRRVGREEDQHVDVELDRVAADLHVALFEDVEQADLDQLVQFGHLVHGEDAAVHARDQAEVQGLLGGHARAGGELGRVDLADDVGELRARGEPLGVALLARPPGDRHAVLGRARRRAPCRPR